VRFHVKIVAFGFVMLLLPVAFLQIIIRSKPI